MSLNKNNLLTWDYRGALLSPLGFFPLLINGKLVDYFNEISPEAEGTQVCQNLLPAYLFCVQCLDSFMEEHSKLQSIIQTLEHSGFYVSIFSS
jgi:hypothetical protein